MKEIRHCSFDDHKYVFTKENPADLLTRGIQNEQLKHSELWWKGPTWLTQGDWPIDQNFEDYTEIEMQSEAENKLEFTNTVQISNSSEPTNTPLVEIERFSSMQKATRVTAYALRFIKNLRNPNNRVIGELNAEEMRVASEHLIMSVQQKCFKNEIQELQTKQKSMATPLVKQLKLFVDDKGLLRCGGRLHNAPIEETMKFPLLLPRRHPLTNLIIQESHEKTNHSGLQSTVTLLRHHFWITSIRQAVKTILRKCVTCKRISGQPYQTPLIAPLPADRVDPSPPFTVTGVDFTGELFVKTANGEQKCYVCLFTCANTRAVHLELVPDLSTNSFMQALRRFAARRSLPKRMISDNASTYQSAAKEIEKLMNHASVQGYLANLQIEWSFIPKRAPWYGGFWERLIGLTKMAIKKTLGRAFVTYDELHTVLCEVEAGLNDRPLTYVYGELTDKCPLTPSQLLHGRQILTLPHGEFGENENREIIRGKRSIIVQRYNYLSNLLKQFWKRWSLEYLPALRERHSLSKSGPPRNVVQKGDVVLIHADNKPRLHWDLATVCDLNYGKDGLIRSVKLNTRHGITNRPLCKLYPLEITFLDDDGPSPSVAEPNNLPLITGDAGSSSHDAGRSPDEAGPSPDEAGPSPDDDGPLPDDPPVRTKRKTAKAAIAEMRQL